VAPSSFFISLRKMDSMEISKIMTAGPRSGIGGFSTDDTRLNWFDPDVSDRSRRSSPRYVFVVAQAD
jgi:hypothetical protein